MAPALKETRVESVEELLSYEQSELILMINFSILCTFLCFFGIAANVVNVIVFCKQGFGYTINISLCCLAVADIFCLTIQLWVNVCFTPLFRKAKLPFVPEEVQYLTGTVPSVCFARINGWITVFITAERCLGIAMPLKVKQVITPKRTLVIMSVLYTLNALAVSSEYHLYQLDWVFYPLHNQSLYGLVVYNTAYGGQVLTYILLVLSGYLSLLAVSIFTVILVRELRVKSAWRQQVSSANTKASSTPNRDRKTMKMIIVIAIIMIACYTPDAMTALTMVFVPEMSLLGKHRNTLLAIASFGILFHNINASVNIFLYYRMSTKFRQTFQSLFGSYVDQNS